MELEAWTVFSNSTLFYILIVEFINYLSKDDQSGFSSFTDFLENLLKLRIIEIMNNYEINNWMTILQKHNNW